jgi:hypothetical protein
MILLSSLTLNTVSAEVLALMVMVFDLAAYLMLALVIAWSKARHRLPDLDGFAADALGIKLLIQLDGHQPRLSAQTEVMRRPR